MNITSRKTKVLALGIAMLVLAGVLLGTGAVSVDFTDSLFEDGEPNILMTPHDGPGGQYVVETEDGQLQINFTDPGLTRNAELQFHRVFDLINEDDETVIVWVTHDNEDILRLYDDATGKAIAGESNAVALAPGERVVVSIDVDSRGVPANMYTGDEPLITTVTFAAEFDRPFFTVDILGIPDEIVAGQTLNVDAEVENIGNVAAEQDVRLFVNGEVMDVQTIELGAGESGAVSFAYETSADEIPRMDVRVESDNDVDERQLEVEPATNAFFDVTIDEIPDEVEVGEQLTVEATIDNLGQAPDSQTIELLVDGEVVDSEVVELGGPNPSSTTVELRWTPREGDEGTVPITVRSGDDEANTTVEVTPVFRAQASASSYAVTANSEVELRAERSITPPDVTPTFSWEVDGQHIGDGEVLSTVLSNPGNREITLTMTGNGRSDTDTITIRVRDDTPPTAAFDVVNIGSFGSDGATVEFDASDSFDEIDGDEITYQWDFGDGSEPVDGVAPTHTYDDPGEYTVSLTVTDTSGNQATMTERIRIESPRATLSTDEIEFGDVAIGSASVEAIEIENTGSTALELTDLAIDSDAFELIGDATDGSFTVGPGDTRSLLVVFTPTEDGDAQAELTFNDNNHVGLGGVSLRGSGSESELTPDTSRLDFGGVSVGDSDELTVLVNNTGVGEIELTGAEILGSDAFEIVDGGTATLAPGETHAMTIAFTPDVGGDRSANLVIGPEGSRVTVALRGTGEAPQMRLSPTTVGFSTIGVGDRSRTTVEVRNTGVEELVIDEASLGGDAPEHFEIEGLPGTVAPGETATFTLRFIPDEAGDHNATLALASNDPQDAQPILVSGSAVGAQIGIDRETLDFGETELGETVSLDIRVRNRPDSPADLTIDRSQIVSGDVDVFEIASGGRNVVLEPGEEEIITVEFTPDQIGPQSAQMQIFSDAGNRPVINVWLSNTRSYILVREVGNPTVNVEGFNLAEGDRHEVNVSMPNVAGESVGFKELTFTNARSGNFEMDIDHETEPTGPSFNAFGVRTVQYIQIDHDPRGVGGIEADADSTFADTALKYHVRKSAIPSGASVEDVTLYRWNDESNQWVDLREHAEVIGESSQYYTFEIETPGFSQFVATVPDQDDQTGSPGDSPGGGPSGGPASPSEGSAESPPEDGPESIQTAVDFGDADADEQPGFSVREVSQDEILELDQATMDELPRALIFPNDDRGRALDEDRAVTIDGVTTTLSAEHSRIMFAGEPAELTGERSTLSSGEAITDRDRMIGAVEINVPPDRQNRPATVRLRIDRERFGASDPREATIGHRTNDGWELLSTEVLDVSEDEVILAAETPGFSIFGVFADPQVEYEWTLPDGTTADGAILNHTFDEPGLYEIELRVTDAFDRTSTATYLVLADDVPQATIDVVDRQGTEVTLAANVDNEIGETDVTWTFADGTEMTGEEVTRSLDDGNHVIELHVIDEFGAESRTEHTIGVGSLMQRAADTIGVELELLVQIGLVAMLGGAFAVGYRWFPWSVFSMARRRGPEITAFEAPVMDASRGQFATAELSVKGGGADLARITIDVIEGDDRTVMEKRLDVSGMAEYVTAPETLTTPPGVTLDPDTAYTIRVKATDEAGKSTERHSSVTVDHDTDE